MFKLISRKSLLLGLLVVCVHPLAWPQAGPPGMPPGALDSMSPEQAELMRRIMSGDVGDDPNALMRDMQAADNAETARRDQQLAAEKAQQKAEAEQRNQRPPPPDDAWVAGFVARYLAALRDNSDLLATQNFRAPDHEAHKMVADHAAQGFTARNAFVQRKIKADCNTPQPRLELDNKAAASHGAYHYSVERSAAGGSGYCFVMSLVPNESGDGEPWLIAFEQWGG